MINFLQTIDNKYVPPLKQYPGAGFRLFRMRLFCTLLLLFISGYHPVQAQVRWLFYAGAGTSHNVFKQNAKNTYLDYYAYRGENGFYILPHAGVSMMVPIGKKLLFETGVNYTRKLFRGEENKILEANTQAQLTVYNESKTKLGYLEFPFHIILYCTGFWPKTPFNWVPGLITAS